MRIEINGTVRDIANSAWISTIDDVSAKSRSDEEVDRVTTFLAKNFHTSPFECISMTYFWFGVAPDGITDLLKSKYTRSYLVSNDNEESHLTIDLWNFIKISAEARAENFYETIAWKLFREFDPRLASKAGMFDFSAQKFYKTPDASESLGDTNMRVELISVHNTGDRLTSRATWRIKCPLSIATQILRHRTGSFNQVSGRYRTVKNEFIANFSDISEILNKIAGNNYYSEYSPKSRREYFPRPGSFGSNRHRVMRALVFELPGVVLRRDQWLGKGDR